MLIYYPEGGGTRAERVVESVGCNSRFASLRQSHLRSLHVKHAATQDLLKDLLQTEMQTKAWSSNMDITHFAECFEIYSSSTCLFLQLTI